MGCSRKRVFRALHECSGFSGTFHGNFNDVSGGSRESQEVQEMPCTPRSFMFFPVHFWGLTESRRKFQGVSGSAKDVLGISGISEDYTC